MLQIESFTKDTFTAARVTDVKDKSEKLGAQTIVEDV